MTGGDDMDINSWENPLKYKSEFQESEIEKNLIGRGEMQRIGLDINALDTKEKASHMLNVAYNAHVTTVDMNIANLKKISSTDTLGQKLIARTKATTGASSWLCKRKIPMEEELNQKMDEATRVFGLSTISKSQRTKRGKKFEEKAHLQAAMFNQMSSYLSEREVALDNVLEHGRNFALGADILKSATPGEHQQLDRMGYAGGIFSFFHQANSSEKISVNERAGEMAKDIAMFYHMSEEEQSDDDRYHSIQRGAMELSDLYKEGGSLGLYQRILNKLVDLDLSQFDYKDNEDFAMAKGDKSFSRKFATLRYYSHCTTMLDELTEKLPDRLPENAEALRVKANLVKEILADYENRALLIQSPYFALLAARDFDSLSDEELSLRRNRTEDPLAKAYLDSLFKQRKQSGFARGESANKILKERLKETKQGKNVSETVQEQNANEQQQQEIDFSFKALADQQAKPREITDELACSSLPFIIDKNISRQECERFKNEILWLHRDLNALAASTFAPKDWSTQEPMAKNTKLYKEVGAATYSKLLGAQQTLENYRAKVAFLTSFAENKGEDYQLEISNYIDSMLSGDEYKSALEEFKLQADAMKKELAKWQSEDAEKQREKELKGIWGEWHFAESNEVKRENK